MNYKIVAIFFIAVTFSYSQSINGRKNKDIESSEKTDQQRKILITFILGNGMIVDRWSDGSNCLRGSFTLSGGQGFSLTPDMTIEQVRQELKKFQIKEEIIPK